jgi:hypothetical protein
MSAERDVNRLVRSWLRIEEHEAADGVLQNVLSRLDTTPQRRPLWSARRFSPMTPFLRIAAAIAAVALIAVLGTSILPGIGGPSPTATRQTVTPTPSPAAVPSPTAGPIALYRSAPSFLPAGKILVSQVLDRSFLITVPSSWTGLEHSGGNALLVKTLKIDGGAERGAFGNVGLDALLGFYAVESVFADPCHDQVPVRPSPTTVDEVVALLSRQVGVTSSGKSSVTVGGLPATQVDLVNAIDPESCVANPFNQWTWSVRGVGTGNGTSSPGHQRVWVMDVDGQLLLINAQGSTLDGAYPEDITELQDTVRTLVFE